MDLLLPGLEVLQHRRFPSEVWVLDNQLVVEASSVVHYLRDRLSPWPQGLADKWAVFLPEMKTHHCPSGGVLREESLLGPR